MDGEILVNIRCPYCRRVFTYDKSRLAANKPFFNAKCPYCEEGIVLSTEMILKAPPVHKDKK